MYATHVLYHIWTACTTYSMYYRRCKTWKHIWKLSMEETLTVS